MYQAIIVIHVLLGLSIIGLILMQQGKGADAGATFGGGASGSVFGAQGAASFLSRTTAILAALFFITSLGLAWINGNKSSPVVDFMSMPEAEKEAPDLGLPNVEGTAGKDNLTAPAPESKPGAVTPAPMSGQTQPSSTAPAPSANPTLEKIDVPKADDVKVVEGKTSAQKTEVKPELPKKEVPKKK